MSFFIKVRDFVYYNRKFFIIGLLLLFFMLFCYLEFYLVKDEVLIDIEESVIIDDSKDDVTSSSIIMVDIKGKVKNPGTYEIEEDSRVIDVVNIAGGILNDADTSSINLSQKVYDEMMITIPSKVDNCDKNNTIVYKDTKVSINNATLSELMNVKGIGEVKAKAIIEYRKNNGFFKKIDDLKNVSGIGENIFEKIKDYIKL